MKPIDRFGLDLNRINFLPPSDNNDELFYFEAARFVKKDNTFSLNNTRYETPVHLSGKRIVLRFDRSRFDRIIIYYKDKRIGEAKPVDLISNGLLKRKGGVL